MQAEVSVRWLNPGAGVLHWHGRAIPFRAAMIDNAVQVWVRGRTHRFTLVDHQARRGASAQSAVLADLTAPMPGTVLQIKVSAGDQVAAHDPLVVLESMKMEMTLSAPGAGRVVEVLCQEGDLVEMGALLLKLDGETTDVDDS